PTAAPDRLPELPREGTAQEPAPIPRTEGQPPAVDPAVPPPMISQTAPTSWVYSPQTAPAPAAPAKQITIDDGHTGPWYTGWLNAGYTLLWIKDAPISLPLAATGPFNAPNFRSLVGGGNAGYSGFDGLFVDGGFWLNERHTVGVGLGGFL